MNSCCCDGQDIVCRFDVRLTTTPWPQTLWPWTFAVHRLWRNETLYQTISYRTTSGWVVTVAAI